MSSRGSRVVAPEGVGPSQSGWCKGERVSLGREWDGEMKGGKEEEVCVSVCDVWRDGRFAYEG